MTPAIYVVPAGAAAAALLVVLWTALRAYLRFSGIRLVTCPETMAPAAVELDAKRAAFAACFGRPALQLKGCGRWRERGPCGQQCLQEIESAPDGCLVRTILTRWYEGKSCIFCAKDFGEIHWLDRKPALMSPAHMTLEWNEIPAEQLIRVLATHRPVCWNCHVAETFRRHYPDLVVDRPWQAGKSHRMR